MNAKRVMFYSVMVIAVLAIVSGCHSRFGHENHSERVLERIDDHVEDLNLSVKQNTQYQELRVRLAEDLEKMKEEHKSFRAQFKTKVNDENASLSEITGVIKEKSTVLPEYISLYLGYLEEFYEILDETQQAELRKEFTKKLNRHWD